MDPPWEGPAAASPACSRLDLEGALPSPAAIAEPQGGDSTVPVRHWRPGRWQLPRFPPSSSECAPVLAPESRVASGSVGRGAGTVWAGRPLRASCLRSVRLRLRSGRGLRVVRSSPSPAARAAQRLLETPSLSLPCPSPAHLLALKLKKKKARDRTAKETRLEEGGCSPAGRRRTSSFGLLLTVRGRILSSVRVRGVAVRI